MAKLIKMIRSAEDTKGGPTEADVHPDEIENYKKGGWVIEEKIVQADSVGAGSVRAGLKPAPTKQEFRGSKK